MSTSKQPIVGSTTPKQLRTFGLIIGGMLGFWFGLLLPWLFNHTYRAWPWIVGGAVVLVALASPRTLRPLYVGWMHVGHVMGWINTRIILGLMFFVAFTPIALLWRLIGKDPMQRGFDPQAATYRRPSKETSPDHMKHPY